MKKPHILLLSVIAIVLVAVGCGRGPAENRAIKPIVSPPDCVEWMPADNILERTYHVQYQDVAEISEAEKEETLNNLRSLTDVAEVVPLVARNMAFMEDREAYIETWVPYLVDKQELVSGCPPERGRSQILVPDSLEGHDLGDKVVLDDKELIISGTYKDDLEDEAKTSDENKTDTNVDEGQTAAEEGETEEAPKSLPIMFISDELGQPNRFDEIVVVFNTQADPADAREALEYFFRATNREVVITRAYEDNGSEEEDQRLSQQPAEVLEEVIPNEDAVVEDGASSGSNGKANAQKSTNGKMSGGKASKKQRAASEENVSKPASAK